MPSGPRKLDAQGPGETRRLAASLHLLLLTVYDCALRQKEKS
nr:MAG TPA: hypothetical protein [Caudoviricetes sp.]